MFIQAATPAPDPAIQTLWRVLLCMGSVFVAFGVLCYFRLYVKFERFFQSKKIRDRAWYILGHVPEPGDTPWLHFLGLLFMILGISALSGLLFLDLAEELAGAVPLVLSLVGIVFTFSSSCVAFWTLWQTHRLEYHSGYKVTGFRELVKELTQKLDDLADMYSSGHVGASHHRVLLVAPQPFYGMLSFGPKDKTYMAYQAALERIASLAANDKSFKFGILCATPEKLREFHEAYERKVKRPSGWLEESLNTVKMIIEIIEKKAGRPIFTRHVDVPKTEFMVVGHKVFTFALENEEGQSEVQEVEVKESMANADRHARLFEILTKLMEPCGETHFPPPTIPADGVAPVNSSSAPSPSTTPGADSGQSPAAALT